MPYLVRIQPPYRGFLVRVSPPIHFCPFFAEQRNAKSTPESLPFSWPECGKIGLCSSRFTAPKPDFTVFCPFFAQNARKNLFCLGRQKRFLGWWRVARLELAASSLRAALRYPKNASGLRRPSRFSTAAEKARALYPPPAAGTGFSQTMLRMVRSLEAAKPCRPHRSRKIQPAQGRLYFPGRSGET